MSKTPSTHEPCGNGHEKPIGQPCGLCLANKTRQREERAERQQDKLDEKLKKIRGED